MKNYFKKITSLLFAFLLLGQVYAKQESVIVGTVEGVKNAIENGRIDIQLEDGIYHDLRIEMNYSGSKKKQISLSAKNPGQVIISGDSHIDLNGDYIHLSGLDFNHGDRNRAEALVMIKGNHNRISQSRFRNYNKVDGVWIQLNGQYNQVDYCWFEGKTSGASYINVDVPKKGGNHHLVDHNFFARPPLGKNGGSAMRIGHGSMATRFCYTVVEFNLFEDCSGEGEIMSSKSCGNTFRYNTFLNCKGGLSLRQGEQGIIESNYFVSRKGEKNRCGGIFIRNRKHLVVNNYFSGLAPKKGGVISFGSGTLPDPKRAAQGIIAIHFPKTSENMIVNNQLLGNKAESIDLLSDYRHRNKIVPTDSMFFYNNVMIGEKTHVRLHEKPQHLVWKNNFYQGKSGVETQGLKKKKFRISKLDDSIMVLKEKGPLADQSWVNNLPEEMLKRLEFRGKKKKLPVGVYFAPKGKRGGLQEMFSKKDVGPNWK